ncbi:hypothetical protein [Hyphomonas pacifica]|uniref:Uncharacterized protein n=1 Tax=Hyphomonas pacifica TaxID=1280941 RepID=A0A062U004_9PROT|nr:hypothetical protein [Hyphomonas pacifica]KCZ47356.1 hypothetical protein HY2_04385 [Hyphomonas pacifica]RAN31272.1 hypothetical protein HY3_04080 [Hyphomonas pacifica]RAN38332.1 hypothetical protein HY11_00545 [Hyphomonas pacifica]
MKKTLAIAAVLSVLVSPAMAREQGEEVHSVSTHDALSQDVHDCLAEMVVAGGNSGALDEAAVLTEDGMGEEFEIIDSDQQETEVEETGYFESEVDETSMPDDAE